MYDIFFNLSDMHQVFCDDCNSLSMGCMVGATVCGSYTQDPEISFELDDEQLTFNFDLDLPEMVSSIDNTPDFFTIKYLNGATCDSCHEIYPYAEESNQRDGTFKCYFCRNYG